jgi:hypothetical protein
MVIKKNSYKNVKNVNYSLVYLFHFQDADGRIFFISAKEALKVFLNLSPELFCSLG